MSSILLRLRWWLATVLVLLTLGSGGLAAAATAKKSDTASKDTPNISNALTQSYNADGSVQIGMIVQQKTGDATTVVPLSEANIRNMLGVVVPTDNATIVLTPQNVTKQQVLVATSGHFNALVTNQNGPIKAGDYITISALDGVGMRTDEDHEQVVGKAAGNFSGTANVIGSVTLKDTLGRNTTVAIGRIPIDINVSHNPLFQKAYDFVPGFMAKVAVAVANKPVSAARIYLSLVVLFATAVITGMLLYSGVRSGMISVGRNPLSKKSIIKSLIQTVMAGLIIFVAGIFAVYLLLKL